MPVALSLLFLCLSCKTDYCRFLWGFPSLVDWCRPKWRGCWFRPPSPPRHLKCIFACPNLWNCFRLTEKRFQFFPPVRSTSHRNLYTSCPVHLFSCQRTEFFNSSLTVLNGTPPNFPQQIPLLPPFLLKHRPWCCRYKKVS